jgi:hypothetical protein
METMTTKWKHIFDYVMQQVRNILEWFDVQKQMEIFVYENYKKINDWVKAW